MIWLTLIVAATLIGALFFINRRLSGNTHELEARESQVTKLRQRAAQVEELIRSWCRVSDNRAVAQELYEVALEILDRISVMAPGHAFAASEQQRLLPIMEDMFRNDSRQRRITTLGSTSEIARLQNELKEIKRILRGRMNNGLLTDGQYQQFCKEINWINSQVALDTYLALARQAFEQNESRHAEKLLKQALVTIRSSDVGDPRIKTYVETTSSLLKQLPPRAAVAE